MIRDKLSTIFDFSFNVHKDFYKALGVLDVRGAVTKRKQLEVIMALSEAVDELEKQVEIIQSKTVKAEPKKEPESKPKVEEIKKEPKEEIKDDTNKTKLSTTKLA